MPRAAKGKTRRAAGLLLVALLAGAAGAQASIPRPEASAELAGWPAALPDAPALVDLGIEPAPLAASATTTAPPAAAAAGDRFGLFDPGPASGLFAAGRPSARARLQAETRLRVHDLELPVRIGLEPLEVAARTRFTLFGRPGTHRGSENRWYDPELGRFITVDPLGFIDGPNSYGYAGNDPINFSDPLGLAKQLTVERQLELIAQSYELAERRRQREKETSWWGVTKQALKQSIGDPVQQRWFAYEKKKEEIIQGAGTAAELAVHRALPLAPIDPRRQQEAALVGLEGQAVTGGAPGAILRDQFRGVSGEIARAGGEATARTGVSAAEWQVATAVVGAVAGAMASRGTATGTVWDAVRATQPVYQGTVIPRSFELATANTRVWVHGNATKHMAEYATSMLRRGVGRDLVNLASQEQIRGLQAAVEAAAVAPRGITYGQLTRVGGWELKFAAPRAADHLPVLTHAIPQ